MTVANTMTETRRPLHLAVLIGASTAIYAVSMAGVTALQASDDRGLIERQSPAEAAAARLRDGHDRLESTIDGISDAYDRAAGGYDLLTPKLTETETSLSELADRVGSITGAARALPGQVTLPPVTRTVVRTQVVSRPATRATTGASGH